MTNEFEKLQAENEQSSEYYDPVMQWRTKDPGSFREIVLRCVEDARIQWSKDMREGGTYNVQTPKGVIPVYFPDQREVCQSVTETLCNLMIGKFDEEAKNKIGDLQKKINESTKYYQDILESLKKTYGQRSWQKAEEIADKRTTNYILNLYREIFQELLLLFQRKNEFSGRKKVGLGS